MRASVSPTKGFTLLELAIVLVVVGLIAGGIVVGRGLIRSAEMRSVATDLDRLKSAINAFQVKYDAVPGDMVNATSFWGIAAGATGKDATCWGTASTSTATCNGDGDGIIELAYAGTDAQEEFLSWKHLSNAGLVAGTYSGTHGPNTFGLGHPYQEAIPGQNVPDSHVAGAGYTLFYRYYGPSYAWFPGAWNHVIIFGRYDIGQETSQRVMTALEMSLLDSKMDNGFPGTGNIRSYTATAFPGCSTTDLPNTSIYDINNPGLNCTVIFLLGF